MTTERRSGGTRRRAAWALTAAFAAFVGAPALTLALRGPEPSSAVLERRAPAPLPRAPRSAREASEWPRKFDAWYDDHFPLRVPLLRAHNRVQWELFARSPNPDALLGRDGWLFTRVNRGLEAGRGAFPLLPNRLDGLRRTFEARERVLAERGIAYLHALAPNKDQIYPEHLPAAYLPCGASRVTQLTEHLAAAGSRARVLDLRPALLAERAHDGERGADDWTFYRLGTHWTDRGAYAAYRAVLDALSGALTGVRVLEREAFAVTPQGQGDSEAPSLYLEDRLLQTAWRWSLGSARRARYDEAALPEGREWTSELGEPGAPTLLVFHDSMGPYLRPYFAESFGRVVSIWGSFDIGLVDEHRPAAVLELYVDRTLVQVPPEPRAFEAPGRAEADFERARTSIVRFAPPRVERPLAAAKGCELADAADGVRLSAQRIPPALELSLPPLPEGHGPALLRIEVTSPAESALDVLYCTRREPELARHNTAFAELQAGRSAVIVELADDELRGPLQLRFSPSKGVYVVHALELRVP